MFCYFGSLHQQLRVGGPPTGSVHRDGSFFLCIWTVYEFAFDVAESFLTRCRGSRNLRPCRCGDFGFVSRHKPAEQFPLFPTLRRHVSRPVAAAVYFSLKDFAAPQYVCSRGADNLSSFVLDAPV